MKNEKTYQKHLIDKLSDLLPGCFILKNDPAENQGIPDLLILFRNTWGMLEVKLFESAPIQPNQPYYIDMFDDMSFASFICPENEEEVLRDLQSTFGVSW